MSIKDKYYRNVGIAFASFVSGDPGDYSTDDAGNEYWTPDGSTWNQINVNGAALVADVGRAGQSHNRFVTVDGSTNPTDIQSATWTEAEAVYSVRFKVIPNTGAVGERVKVVFDASPVDDTTNTTQAANWLTTVAESEDTDVEYFELVAGGILGTNTGYISPWSDWFQFSSPLRRVDFLAMDADSTYDIFIEVA